MGLMQNSQSRLIARDLLPLHIPCYHRDLFSGRNIVQGPLRALLGKHFVQFSIAPFNIVLHMSYFTVCPHGKWWYCD